METRVLSEVIENIREHVLPMVPKPLGKTFEEYLSRMEDLLLSARAARFAVVGRRGAGKSSLINAMFGEKVANVGSTTSTTGKGTWHSFTSSHGELEILDTRGMGEGSKPTEETASETVLGEIKIAIREKCPDAILFLVKAKEVDARIDEDLAGVEDILKFVKIEHEYQLPIVGIVTQVDELDPADLNCPPFEDEEKLENIGKVQDDLKNKMKERLPYSVLEVVPVSAYMRFKDGRMLVDRRWQIDTLLEYLCEVLPNSTHLQLARMARMTALQRNVARALGHATAMMTAAIGAFPIPFSDIFPITGLQITMIMGTGYIAGHPMTKETAHEFLVAMGLTVGAGFALRTLAQQLIKFIPVLGSAGGAAIAYAGTIALSEAAIAYFIDGQSAEETRRVFEQVKAEATENPREEVKDLG